MDVPRLGVESELQLPAYTTATAMQAVSLVCSLHHSSQQCQILYPLSEARDRSCNLMVLSRIRFCRTMTGTPETTINCPESWSQDWNPGEFISRTEAILSCDRKMKQELQQHRGTNRVRGRTSCHLYLLLMTTGNCCYIY